MTSDFNYKKYSLENLENWMYDAMSSAEASPQEIYDVIKGVVEENYHTYKHQASQAYELLALLNGNGKGHIEAYDAVMREKEYYEPSMPPWGHSDMEALRYTTEYKGSTSSSVSDNMPPFGYSAAEYGSSGPSSGIEYINGNVDLYGSVGDCINFNCGHTNENYDEIKQDKVVKWQLPVEEVKDSDTDETEYFITFPEDLLEAANLKVGDIVAWIDNGDGTYTLKHKTMSDTITPGDPYKDEMIASGYKMVDGVWAKVTESLEW
jgi:hypothetical protein